jgi:hypothetical protein
MLDACRCFVLFIDALCLSLFCFVYFIFEKNKIK